MRNWEFTGETKEAYGVTLRRIRAAIDFTLKCGIKVAKGEIGGWIEKESNLSGNAWVSGNEHLLTIGRIGSESDTVTFFRNKAGTIYVDCGCFFGTLNEFRDKIRQTHGDTKHAKVYGIAADLAEAQIDTTPIENEVDKNAAD